MPSLRYVHVLFNLGGKAKLVFTRMGGQMWLGPSLLFFRWKKDGSCRPVINYQKLNEITIKDSYLLPHIDEVMD